MLHFMFVYCSNSTSTEHNSFIDSNVV